MRNDMQSAMGDALRDAVQKPKLDPYSGGGEAKMSEAQEHQAMLRPLNPETDIPEGFQCSDATWNRLNELRHAKIEAEIALKKEENQLSVMSKHSAVLTEELDRLTRQDGEVSAALQAIRDSIARNTEDVELLTILKQGQDESVKSPIVTDYSACVLTDRGIVESLNGEIRSAGSDKVGVLTKIKEFRKRINFMIWEKSYSAYKAENLEEHYTDLHMLRVTKELQTLIKGGDAADSSKTTLDKAEAQMEHKTNAHRARCKKLRIALGKLKKTVQSKLDENSRLRSQVGELDTNVSVRQSIQASRATGSSGVIDPNRQKMQSIVTRRKLIDLARAQTDEIEFLRQELDRLRQRTFPSFAHAAARNGGVDEL